MLDALLIALVLGTCSPGPETEALYRHHWLGPALEVKRLKGIRIGRCAQEGLDPLVSPAYQYRREAPLFHLDPLRAPDARALLRHSWDRQVVHFQFEVTVSALYYTVNPLLYCATSRSRSFSLLMCACPLALSRTFVNRLHRRRMRSRLLEASPSAVECSPVCVRDVLSSRSRAF